jgi:hypothetical protein
LRVCVGAGCVLCHRLVRMPVLIENQYWAAYLSDTAHIQSAHYSHAKLWCVHCSLYCTHARLDHWYIILYATAHVDHSPLVAVMTDINHHRSSWALRLVFMVILCFGIFHRSSYTSTIIDSETPSFKYIHTQPSPTQCKLKEGNSCHVYLSTIFFFFLYTLFFFVMIHSDLPVMFLFIWYCIIYSFHCSESESFVYFFYLFLFSVVVLCYFVHTYYIVNLFHDNHTLLFYYFFLFHATFLLSINYILSMIAFIFFLSIYFSFYSFVLFFINCFCFSFVSLALLHLSHIEGGEYVMACIICDYNYPLLSIILGVCTFHSITTHQSYINLLNTTLSLYLCHSIEHGHYRIMTYGGELKESYRYWIDDMLC